MNTIPEQMAQGGRRRRTHSDEFKAGAVAACLQPGISTAAVAMSHGVNANLLRRWVHEAQMKPLADATTKKKIASTAALAKTSFVPVTLPTPAGANQDIRIELRRGAMSMDVAWPSNAAAECAAWMRELLR